MAERQRRSGVMVTGFAPCWLQSRWRRLHSLRFCLCFRPPPFFAHSNFTRTTLLFLIELVLAALTASAVGVLYAHQRYQR